jgi:hypothetical protein
MNTQNRISSLVMWAPLAALVLAIPACGRSHRETATAQTATPTTAAQPSPAPPTEPVSLTGCLQKGNHGTYVLTELNRPRHPDSSSPAVVAREKLAAAEEAYVLKSDTNQDLSKLVGDRVHVEGTVKRAADLSDTQPTSAGLAATAGQAAEVKAVESGHAIEEKDLAEIQVTSFRKLADTCGTHTARRPHRSK